ncbi:MAG TPA: right-handed parallel beta-helix repeat-containing protein [Steroidobacteraceae bacterium]|nr:right-handed parallel beta-helix repeat-containing protein [Steroidobacteraceae bacterium]
MRRKYSSGSALRTLCLTALALLASVASATTTIEVSTVTQLQNAVTSANNAGGDYTILVDDGTYTLSDTLYVTAPNITIAGKSNVRENVIIQGDAMSASAVVGNVIRVSGSNFTLHHVTLQHSGWHAIQVAGESNADNPYIHDCVLRDTYEQLLKVSYNSATPGIASDNGRVENCLFEYTAGIGPEYYIGGIDAHASTGWEVRNNTFENIASPNTAVAEFAVHFWDGSANNTVEDNYIINCDRGIGFGLQDSANTGGIIRNNMIYHANNGAPFADVAIALADSPNSQVYNNTAFLLQNFQWAIEYRFAQTTGVLIENNLLNLPVQLRDGASGTVSTNYTAATAAMFVSPSTGNLHLASAVAGVVGAGKAIAGLTDDIDGQTRPSGSIDIGADQYSSGGTGSTGSTVPMPPTNVTVQ